MEIEGLMSTFIIVEKTKREKKRRPPCIHYIALVMHRGQLIFDIEKQKLHNQINKLTSQIVYRKVTSINVCL